MGRCDPERFDERVIGQTVERLTTVVALAEVVFDLTIVCFVEFSPCIFGQLFACRMGLLGVDHHDG